MSGTDWIPLVVAFVAIAGAFGGNMYEQAKARKIQTSQMFAKALELVHEYESLPFLVRRRPGSTPEFRWEHQQVANKLHTGMDFHVALLEITAPNVAHKYRELAKAARGSTGPHIKDAWTKPVVTADTEMNANLGDEYNRKEDVEQLHSECIRAMRQHLSLWPWPWSPLRTR